MKQGVIIVGLGSDYLGMALNLCLSIKSNNRDQSVTLITDKRQEPELLEQISKYFNDILDVGNLGAEYPPFKRSMFLKLKANDLSPYEKTLLLDADTLMLPGKDMNVMFNSFGQQKFVAYNNGSYSFATKQDTGRYNYWCNPVSAGKYFNIPATSIFPQINASLIYFKKSARADIIFRCAIAVWFDKEFKHYMQFNGSKTEEFCFNVALAKNGVVPWPGEIPVYKPLFIPLHHDTWSSEEYIYQTFKGISLAGYSSNNLDDRLTSLYNRLVEFYGRFFQADNLWGLKPDAKAVSIKAPINGFWHVCMMGNWKTVVLEQLQLMQRSGLLSEMYQLNIVAVGSKESEEQLRELINTCGYDTKIVICAVLDDFKLYEYPTLNLLKETCNNSNYLFFGFYIHTKGVSQPDNEAKTHWREYLNHYTIAHWGKHYDALKRGNDISGVNWLPANGKYPSHFSGNFWWFQSSYIAGLQDINTLDQSDRFQAEMWVARGKPKKFVLSSKVINDQKSEWFPMRKIAILYHFDLQSMDRYKLVREQLTALQDSGLLAESYTFAQGYCSNEGAGELKLINTMFDKTVVEKDGDLKQTEFYGHFMGWWAENPDAYVLFLNSAVNEKCVAQVNSGLIYDWRYCYNKLLQGANKVFVPSSVTVGKPMLDSYWSSNFHATGKELNFKVLKHEV